MKATLEQFAKLWTDIGGKGDPTPQFNALADAYSSGTRRYHTLEHVGWVLHRLSEMETVERHRGAKFDEPTWNAIKWAAWFHDYALAGRPEDEQESAWAGIDALHAAYGQGGAPMALTSAVDRLIMATAHDRVPLQYDAAILCDADLSILGAPSDAFDHYEQLVREEWAHVPDELFAGGRLAILRRIDRRPRIYWTRYGREHWEDRARDNLERSMVALALRATPDTKRDATGGGT